MFNNGKKGSEDTFSKGDGKGCTLIIVMWVQMSWKKRKIGSQVL